ncbi:516_t:CDS:2 [Cetraspora pellucida]|uniref:516_t:CDS:1 n=1 Tax=Cetraspora pellucida TaxID=1433469 RepID=A0A9N9FN78_9GLOM|nr:516_t:CDS:2 [Cetraspora pellucida]
MNTSNDYSSMEITPDNQNNFKRRNGSNLGTTGRRIQYPTTINSRYQKYQTKTWHKDSRGLRETSNEFRSQSKFGGLISEAIDLTETEQPHEKSVSQRTPDNNERTMDIRATPVLEHSYTNDSSTRLLQVPNGITHKSRTTTPERTGSVQCKICSGTLGQHEYWDCPNAICNKCRKTEHTYQNCPYAPLLKNRSWYVNLSENKEYQYEYCLKREHK